jgi:RNA polymerase primary sigma factor
MDLEYLGRVLDRLQPFVRDRTIRRTRLERVLGTFRSAPEGLPEEIERLLAQSGITIEEDRKPVEDEKEPSVEHQTAPHRDAAKIDDLPGSERERSAKAAAAARQRIARDRHIVDLSRPLLTPLEEIGLAALVRGPSGEPLEQGGFAHLTGEARAAAQCLLLHNQRLVHSVAQSYTPPGMTHDDLFQHGMVGLIRAVELFDPARGNKFSTYAMNWIRQSITRGIANESRLIRLPVHMYERVQKVWRVRATLTVDGEEPSVHQLALACELRDDQVMECLMLGPQDILSLDTPVGPEGETTLGEIYERPDPDADPELAAERVLLEEQLHSVLDTLAEREAGVVAMRFGMTDGVPKTLDEIGKVYGVTRERIRQIESKLMSKLRHPSRAEALWPYLFGTDMPPGWELESDHGNSDAITKKSFGRPRR